MAMGEFLKHLESITSFLKFTSYYGGNEIIYLDVNLKINLTNKLVSRVQRKPTFMNRYMHFTSNQPLYVKKNVLKGQFIEAFCITSDNLVFQQETDIKKTFLNQGYPNELISQNTDFILKVRHENFPPILDSGGTLRKNETNENVERCNNMFIKFHPLSFHVMNITDRHWVWLQDLMGNLGTQPGYTFKRG